MMKSFSTLSLSLPDSLKALADTRIRELQQKYSDNAVSNQIDSLNQSEEHSRLLYLFAMSDFIYQQCHRYEFIYQSVTRLCYSLNISTSERLPSFETASTDFYSLNEVQAMTCLRQYRQHVMVMIAARNFLQIDDIQQTMLLLSNLADEFYCLARDWTVHSLKPRYGEALTAEGETLPLIALGMGKLGGYELNFSSDIDLIFCYQRNGETQGGRRTEDFHSYFTKVAQKIIQLLDSPTADGRVYRVDMRLRPFGDSGQLVSSFAALEDYYQEQGREWERFALLKARPLGLAHLSYPLEPEHKQQLQQILTPFVYRRYIDFSVIESLRQMKRLIQQEVARRQLTNNIKLGAGGIREIEFIVQALQILRGGQERQLQQPSLLSVLPELQLLGLFDEHEMAEFRSHYLWLRQCEQYLQAFADQQTQTLPDDDLNKQRLCQKVLMPAPRKPERLRPTSRLGRRNRKNGLKQKKLWRRQSCTSKRMRRMNG